VEKITFFVNVKPKTTLLRRCLSLRETLEDLLGLGKKEEATGWRPLGVRIVRGVLGGRIGILICEF
jgi:hypothetical protein